MGYALANISLAKRVPDSENADLDGPGDEDAAKLSKIMNKVLCDTPYWPGDHLEAASPIEASFWPIHPTLDRLLQYKDLVRPFTNKTWDASKTADVCVYHAMPVRTAEDDGIETYCEGHHPYDLTFWKTVHYDETTGTYMKHHLTNEEVRDNLLPATG